MMTPLRIRECVATVILLAALEVIVLTMRKIRQQRERTLAEWRNYVRERRGGTS